MEEFEVKNTPFKDITGRYFFITGCTEDNIVNDKLQFLNLEWELQGHLQKLGYERIVFYNRTQKLYCYDEQSMTYLRFGKKDKKPSSSPQEKKIKAPGMKGGPLGRRRLTRHSVQENVQKQSVEPLPESKEEMPLHMGKMQDLATYQQIRSCLLDEKIKTAVIFTNANDFIQDYSNPDIADCFDRFSGVYADNKNIVLFIFPNKSEAEIAKQYEHSGGVWKDLFQPAFVSNHNIIHIGLPNIYEIRNLLNYMRLKPGKRLKINVGEIEEISKILLKDAVSNNYQLKYIYHCLDSFIEKDKTLCLDNVQDVLGSKKEKSAMEELDEIIGMEDLKKEIRELKKRIETNEQEMKSDLTACSSRLVKVSNKKVKINMHMLLTGNPGTGKTTVARILGKVYYEIGLLPSPKVVEVDKQALVAGYLGQTAIKTQNKINEAMGKVLFIDEAYTLYQTENDGSNTDSFGKEVIDTLMKAMEDHRGEFAVIAAGYALKMQSFMKANEGLASRFDKRIHIKDYEPEELNEIFHSMAKQRGYMITSGLEEILPGFFYNWTDVYRKEPPWSNAREVRKLIEDIDTLWSNSDAPEIYVEGVKYKQLKQEHFPRNCQKNFKKGYRRKTGQEQLEELIGFDKLKEELRKLYNLKLQMNKPFSEDGNMMNKLFPEDEDMVKLHCVLKGNPGTGKTTVARLLGKIYQEIGWLPVGNVVEVQSSDLMSRFVNGTASKVREEVQKALGGVLFVDEAYKLYREEGQNNTGLEAIEEIMKCMDDYAGQFAVVLAGYPEEMEVLLSANKGLQRRFKTQYILEDYSACELRQIFELMLHNKHIRLSEEFQEKLPIFIENFLNTWANDEKKEQWGNAGEVENLVEDLIKNHGDKQGKIITEGEDNYRLITLEYLPENLQSLVHPMDSSVIWKLLDSMTGLHSVRERLKKMEARMIYQKEKKSAGHYIFKGNPGTGKTTVARMMGQLLRNTGALKRGHVVDHTAKELMEQRALLGEAVKKAKDGILFIDEAHQLMEDGRGRSVLTELVPILENQKDWLTVICAGYPLQMDQFMEYDPGMPSRFPVQLVFEDYNEKELMQILEGMVKQQGYDMDSEYRKNSQMVMYGLVKNKTASFGNARDVRNYLQESIDELSVRLYNKYHGRPDQVGADELHCLTGEDIAEDYKKYISLGSSGKKKAEEKIESIKIMPSFLGKQSSVFQKNQDNISEYLDSVVFVQIENKNGEIKSYGSGFIVSFDGYIITCCHVVDQAEVVKIRLKIKENIFWCSAKIVTMQRMCDLALLKIEGYNYPPLTLGSKNPNLGQKLVLLGYPFGKRLSDDIDKLNPSFFSGNVSSINSKNGYDRIYVNVEAKSGCSGAPVISEENGNVIGILRGSIIDQGKNLTEELNYIIPVKYIWQYFVKDC